MINEYSSSNRGFTLLEILVAIAILAISLTVILQLFSGGLRSVRVSDRHTQGVFHAREKMEEILLEERLDEGSREGEFDDDYKWIARIVRMVPPEEEEKKLPFDVYAITVKVVWQERKGETNFEIQTMKLVERVEDNQG